MKLTAGIVLYRLNNKKVQVLLVSNGRSWSVPKGALNTKESAKTAACRELFEETQLKAPAELIELGHVVDPRRPEKLSCYIAEYKKKKNPIPSAEIKQCRFVSLSRARKLIAPYQTPLLQCLEAIERLERSPAA